MGILGFSDGALLRSHTTSNTQSTLSICKSQSLCSGSREVIPHHREVRPSIRAVSNTYTPGTGHPDPRMCVIFCISVISSHRAVDESFSLLPSHHITPLTDIGLRTKIVAHIMTQHDELNDHHHNRNVAAVRKALPKSYARWGKLRIEPGGDIISTASILDTDDASARRDNTFVRVRSVYLCSSGHTHATVAV